ncbi:MAG TPA: cupin domain-containing protein [Xanthomonadales bacterium]|nr:cupin domain-containing protein [Xanthomonadales bacterium]
MKVSVRKAIAGLTYLPNRDPEMGHDENTSAAFAELAKYRDGAIHVGYYSGSSEWERHPAGDELVMALDGETTLILLIDGEQQRVPLGKDDLAVVPRNVWHRFEDSDHLKVFAVTPEPSDHQLEVPSTS